MINVRGCKLMFSIQNCTIVSNESRLEFRKYVALLKSLSKSVRNQNASGIFHTICSKFIEIATFKRIKMKSELLFVAQQLIEIVKYDITGSRCRLDGTRRQCYLLLLLQSHLFVTTMLVAIVHVPISIFSPEICLIFVNS